MLKVLSLLKPHRISIVIALFLMLIELAVELIQPLLMAKIIDDGIMLNDLPTVLKWGGWLVGIALIAFIGAIINSFYSSHVSQSFGYDLRERLFEKIQSFSFANFNLFPTSSLITRITNDVNQIQSMVFTSMRIMIRAPLFIVFGMVMALTVHFKLAFALLAAVPLLMVFLYWVMNRGYAFFRTVQLKLDAVNNVMRENLFAMRLIKAFLRSKYESQRFKTANEDLMKGTKSALWLMETSTPVLLFVMNTSILSVLWFGSLEIHTGDAQVGEVVAILNYATRMIANFTVFSFIIMLFARARASAKRVVEVLEAEVDLLDAEDAEGIDDAPGGARATKGEQPTTHRTQGQLEFVQVSFQYPGTKTPVLQDLSFTIHSGQTVAILGATGSGKTSLLQLIPRLYDVSAGTIKIDGRDIRTIKLDHLRQKIGFVPQEVVLFSGTMKENIAWGKSHAGIEEIITAAKHAQIHATISKLPAQYDTVLGQKGVNLSGGQKQRLSIARALIRRPSILLLDDSTSALDVETEANLLGALQSYSCTTIIVTQKISTAIGADTILLLEDGKLLARGDHRTLLQQSELYRRIVESQAGKEGVRDVRSTC